MTAYIIQPHKATCTACSYVNFMPKLKRALPNTVYLKTFKVEKFHGSDLEKNFLLQTSMFITDAR